MRRASQSLARRFVARSAPQALLRERRVPASCVLSPLQAAALPTLTDGPAHSRTLFSGAFSGRKIALLEQDANKYPTDAYKQALLLRTLNDSNPAEVLRRVESHRFAFNEAVAKEYVKALVATGRIDQVNLDEINKLAHRAHDMDPPAQVAEPVAGATVASLPQRMSSSPEEPLHVALPEPSLKQQLWRTVRVMVFAYILLLAVSTIMDERAAGGGKNSVINHDVKLSKDNNKTFADVVGVDEAKAELEEMVEYLRDPSKFNRLGGKMTKGVLLMGPPGTGKTMLARAIAGEAGVPFFYTSGSEFEEMYVGVGARRVRDLFETAKASSPCIIFIDEIDAIGATRNPKDQQYMRMTLNQLLAEMDGFHPTDGVIVVGATNFPEVLDKALMRPGRFDRHVTVPNPDVGGRRQILKLHLSNVPTAANVDIGVLARSTPGFSGADLANLVNLGAVRASTLGRNDVSMAELEFAKDRIVMGAERKSAVISEKNRRVTAFHEGGHALVALHTNGATPVHKATIVPRGMALGMVTQLPEEDETSWSKKQMLARLDVCMGGRVAEELIFGDEEVTSGASSDIEQATRVARLMVEKFGMSEKIGLVAHSNDDGFSPQTKQVIDKEVYEITQAAYLRAKALLKKHGDELERIANALLEYETLSADELRNAAAGRPVRP